VRHLLRPLVRLLLANGVPYPALAALLKEIYFEVASQDLAPGEKRQTNSQISLITGIHRKDVRRMLENGTAPEALQKETSLASEVITRWISDPSFMNARKKPLALARLASAGGARSFEFLAASISKDVRARALLDELLRLGMVAVDHRDRVVLNQHAFVPRQGSEEMAFYFGQKFGDSVSLIAGKISIIDYCNTKPFMGGVGIDSFWNLVFTAPPSGTPFLGPDLATNGIVKSGYTVNLENGDGGVPVTASAMTCNTVADANSAYWAHVEPVAPGSTGQRSFASDRRNTIYQNAAGVTIAADMSGGTVLR